MGNRKLLFLTLGVIVVGIVGFVLVRGTNTNPEPVQNQTIEQETSDAQGVQETQDTNSQVLSERYLTYSEENLKKATENNGKAIVFFHAGWCPSCQAAEKELKEKWSEVPQDVTILKTDYDTSTELKAKYGITMQDTWVQVNSQGNEITKWNSGGEGLKTLLANLK